MNSFYRKYGKRIMGFMLASLLVILLSPLFIFVAIIIKLDGGPVFFKQERLGFKGEPFYIYKFRTMIENAEHLGDGLTIKSENDNRITPIGRILRKTSIDELPQIINIIKGEMSFIGPRPPVTYYPYSFDEYPKDFIKRFDTLPGITGLAQVEVRNSATWDERFIYDLKYIEDLSFKNDLLLVIRTIQRVLSFENLY